MPDGGMDHHKMMCNMNMLFTWDTTNLCIIFKQWRITGTISLILSLLGVVALTAGYEFVREMSRRYEQRHNQEMFKGLPKRDSRRDRERAKLGKAAFYAVQVFYSFFIMLLFMTYNGWIMLAVAVGAFVGYLIWGNSSSTKSVACH
ncbi:MAG: hypothetical protein M1823_001804 [Watsoniomyces obsoletus]|nr:MAG: hypothetical protein M1823_001804 [Watsoniomyces obsoletus]